MSSVLNLVNAGVTRVVMPSKLSDADRLVWLRHNVSGAEMRRIGICLENTGDTEEFRKRIDEMITADAQREREAVADTDYFHCIVRRWVNWPNAPGQPRRASTKIECPKCGQRFDQPVCDCGYEHSCGGPAEACCIPGCTECGAKPNATGERPETRSEDT